MKRLQIISTLLCVFLFASFTLAQDSLNVRKTGSLYHFWDTVTEVKIHGNYAYCTASGSGLRIVDMSNPAQLNEVGFFGKSESFDDIEIVGNYAYVAAFQTGVYVLDVSNPISPVQVGFIATLSEFASLAASGYYLYVSNGTDGVRVYDVSSPVTPVEVGHYNPVGYTLYSVILSGNYALVIAENLLSQLQLQILNISDPTHPAYISSIALSLIGSGNIAIHNNYVFIASNYFGVRIFDISIPATPVQVGSISGIAGHVFYANGYLYASQDNVLSIINVSNPLSPVYAGEILVSGYITDVAESGTYAGLNRQYQGMCLLDLTNPANPVITDSISNFEQIQGLALAGNYAYLTGTNDARNLRIVDLSNPFNPTEVGVYHAPNHVRDIAVFDNYAYAIEDNEKIRILNISDPVTPVEIGIFNLPANANDIVRAGNYAFVTTLNYLIVYDMTNPANPIEIGSYTDDSGYLRGMAIVGNHLYVASETLGLIVLDISNPAQPSQVGNCMFGYCDNVTVSGNYAYITAMDDALRIIDITNPTNPYGVGSFTIPQSKVVDVSVSGHYAYLACAQSGLRVVDVANPEHPVEVGFYDSPLYSSSVEISGNYVYSSDVYEFSVYDCSAALVMSDPFILHPSSFILSSFPNPFNPSTTISFTLPQAGEVNLRVFDVLGREVSTIKNGFLNAGEHRMIFDGSNLASGIYFAELVIQGHLMTNKLLLIK